MPFKLNIDTIPLPALPKLGRSSIQQVRRMLLLRWSAGKHLTTIARNNGVERPALGFSDDDFFRACLQVLAGDYKAIVSSFVHLLEIVLGPYETMYFELSKNASVGDGFVEYEPYGNYFQYANWNATAFNVGERITAIHPQTARKTIALVKEQDTALDRIYFVDEYRQPDATSFDTNHRVIGQGGGAADVSSRVIRRSYEDFPLYGTMTIDPGGANEEEVLFVCPDPYLGRVRIIDDLSNNHVAGEKIKIEGGCWDFIETRARRIVVRIKCPTKNKVTFRGNAFLHQYNQVNAKLRTSTAPGDVTLSLDDQILEPLTGASFPIRIYLNPEGTNTSTNSKPLALDASSYNSTTRQFALPVALPAGANYKKDTTVRVYHAKTGEMLDAATAGDTEIICRARWENPTGVWTIDSGGGNEEKVFVESSSYKKRTLAAQIIVNDTEVWLTETIYPLDTSHAAKLVVSDPTGVLGVLDVDTTAAITHPQRVPLSSPATFVTAVQTNKTTVEYCRGADFGVTVYLGSGLLSDKPPLSMPLDFAEFIGATAEPPTFNDHLAKSTWPTTITAPDGRFPGPHLYDANYRSPSNDQATGLVEIEIDRTTMFDARIYLAHQTLASDYNPATAPALPAKVWAGRTYIPKKVVIDNGYFFPTDAVIQTWNTSRRLNPTLEPVRVVVSGEGTFGRDPLYLWGRGAAGSREENVLHVSGIKRSHAAGVSVMTYTEVLPVSGPVGFVGGNPGLETQNGTLLLDHGHSSEEEISYNNIQSNEPDRAHLLFDRGLLPANSHDPFRAHPNKVLTVLGCPLVRADKIALPRKDGYSFPFYLNGGLTLRRLKALMNAVRAAGIHVTFVDDKDRLIKI